MVQTCANQGISGKGQSLAVVYSIACDVQQVPSAIVSELT